MKIKDLKQEHPAIYKRILECQVEQGNVANDELDLIEDHGHGNFSWGDTVEGWNMWACVNNGNYQTFYNKYPQEAKPVPTYVVNGETYHYGEEVEVSDYDNDALYDKRILVFTDSILIMCVSDGYEEAFKEGKKYYTCWWKHIRKLPQITKLTKQQIADKFELDVNLIEII